MSNRYNDVSWVGKKFQNLTVVKAVKSPDGKPGWFWECLCDCGKTIVKYPQGILMGHVVSCGCADKTYRHGLSHDKNGKITRLYSIWVGMRVRCYNESRADYKHYGGRGIKICDEWNTYPVFYEWAMANGYSAELTIDRINCDGNYEPTNCRWATAKEQANNKRKCHAYKMTGKNRRLYELLLMRLEGATYQEIADGEGVTAQNIQHIVSRQLKKVSL